MSLDGVWPPLAYARDGAEDSERPRLLTAVADGVGYLVLDRPERRNALDERMRAALMAALAAWRDDDAVRVVLVTGRGSCFAAGADLEEMQARDEGAQRAFIEPPHIYDAVASHPKPVIACVNGHALGAGCELILACDVRIAAAGVKIGQPEINLGIIPGGGGTQRLPRLVGLGRALDMILSGEAVTSERAYEIGLVEHTFPRETLWAEAQRYALRLAGHPAIALRLAKQTVRASAESTLAEGLALEIDGFMEAFEGPERRQRIQAFLNKA